MYVRTEHHPLNIDLRSVSPIGRICAVSPQGLLIASYLAGPLTQYFGSKTTGRPRQCHVHFLSTSCHAASFIKQSSPRQYGTVQLSVADLRTPASREMPLLPHCCHIFNCVAIIRKGRCVDAWKRWLCGDDMGKGQEATRSP
jgi:hypothetical protein